MKKYIYIAFVCYTSLCWLSILFSKRKSKLFNNQERWWKSSFNVYCTDWKKTHSRKVLCLNSRHWVMVLSSLISKKSFILQGLLIFNETFSEFPYIVVKRFIASWRSKVNSQWFVSSAFLFYDRFILWYIYTV